MERTKSVLRLPLYKPKNLFNGNRMIVGRIEQDDSDGPIDHYGVVMNEPNREQLGGIRFSKKKTESSPSPIKFSDLQELVGAFGVGLILYQDSTRKLIMNASFWVRDDEGLRVENF